jgi:hypothetical protein
MSSHSKLSDADSVRIDALLTYLNEAISESLAVCRQTRHYAKQAPLRVSKTPIPTSQLQVIGWFSSPVLDPHCLEKIFELGRCGCQAGPPSSH